MKKPNRFVVLYVTFPNLKIARKITRGLVEGKLVACASMFRIFSIYRWQGKIEKNPEYGALMKTKKEKYKAVEEYIRKHHPYEVPEVIAWNVDQGQENYLQWINSVTD
jgi:periplasmic divalent cation tolerance protein